MTPDPDPIVLNDEEEPFGCFIGILNVLGFWIALGILGYLAHRAVT